eukprot:g9134.t1
MSRAVLLSLVQLQGVRKQEALLALLFADALELNKKKRTPHKQPLLSSGLRKRNKRYGYARCGAGGGGGGRRPSPGAWKPGGTWGKAQHDHGDRNTVRIPIYRWR